MVEKKQAINHDAAPIELGDARDQVGLSNAPDGLLPIATVRDETASLLLELAERHVAEAREKLGPQSSKPRLDRIRKLFSEKAGIAPRLDQGAERLLGSAGFKAQLATYESTYHHTLAIAANNFDKISIQSGAALQTAYDDWTMAVSIYKSEARAAGAVLEAETSHPALSQMITDYEGPTAGRSLVEHYNRSSNISDSLLRYERFMQRAATNLSVSFARLIEQLYSAVTDLAVAEATLIAVDQEAHKAFWVSAQNALSQSR